MTYKEGNVYYAYSLKDILYMIPRKWTLDAEDGKFVISLLLDDETNDSHTEKSNEIIDAVFNMLKWCKINRKI